MNELSMRNLNLEKEAQNLDVDDVKYKSLLLYNRAFQLIEKYIKREYFAPEIKFPFTTTIVKEGIEGIVVISSIFEAGITEELIVRIDGKKVALEHGEAFVPLKGFAKGDTINVVLENHNNLTGVINSVML